MDFTKYISMLEERALYFSRSDQLGDPYEGMIPRKSMELYRLAMSSHRVPAEATEKILEFLDTCRYQTYLNCWHLNEHESAALWKLYSSSNDSVAIKSSFDILFNCINGTENDSYYLGVVKYINFDSDIIQMNNTLWPFIHKRSSFSHEQEVRIVKHKIGDDIHSRETPLGIWHTVDISKLITTVYVSPSSSPWFAELVRAVSKRYELDVAVVQSDLFSAPVK